MPCWGLFVNSLALRVQLSDDGTIADLLTQVHKTVIAAKKHQDIPFEKLVDSLMPERDPSRHPVFQVMFGMSHFNEVALAPPFAAVDEAMVQAAPSPAKFDLSLFISDGQSCIRGNFNYATRLFAGQTIANMARIYQQVLAAMVADVSQSVAQIDWLGSGMVTGPVREYRQQPLVSTFESQVEQHPDVLAVVCGDVSLSYRELNGHVNALAADINHQGRPVALYMDRSAEMLIAMLAILKAGSAYVPVSPDNPQERTRMILQDCGARQVVTQPHYQAQLAALNLTAIELLMADRSSEPVAENPVLVSGICDLAYIIYTSGTSWSTQRGDAGTTQRGQLRQCARRCTGQCV